MRNENFDTQQLLQYMHGKIMVAKQRAKYLRRKWNNFLKNGTNNEQFLEVAKGLMSDCENFIQSDLHCVHRIQKKLYDAQVSRFPADEELLEISSEILESACIIGMSDLGPKAFFELTDDLYHQELKNFLDASNEMLTSLQKLKNFCNEEWDFSV